MQNRLDKDPWGPQSEGSWPWRILDHPLEIGAAHIDGAKPRRSFWITKNPWFFGEFPAFQHSQRAAQRTDGLYLYIYCILYIVYCIFVYCILYIVCTYIYIYIMYGYSPVKSCSVSHGNHRSCHRFTSPSNVRVLRGTGRLSLELHETIPIVDVPSGKQPHSYWKWL